MKVLPITSPDFIGPVMDARQKYRLQKRLYYKKNRLRECTRVREWKHANPDRVRVHWRKGRKKHAEKFRERQRRYRKNRMLKSPAYGMMAILRTRVITAIKQRGGAKSYRTAALIGCTVPELLRHIESQFLPGMTWGNHTTDGWHVDHIIPCAAFDLTIPEHQAMCFNYANLRPIWARDNQNKRDRITREAIALIASPEPGEHLF